MNRYSTSSIERLRQCHPDLQMVFSVVLLGWDNKILTGHRGREEQEAHFKAKRSKVQYPNSKHNKFPSDAVDAAPYPIPDQWGAVSRDELEKFRHFAFYVLGVADALRQAGIISSVIRWGGDWNQNRDVTDNKFDDLVHFERVEV